MILWDSTENENGVGHTLVCPFVRPTRGKLKFTLQRLTSERSGRLG